MSGPRRARGGGGEGGSQGAALNGACVALCSFWFLTLQPQCKANGVISASTFNPSGFAFWFCLLFSRSAFVAVEFPAVLLNTSTGEIESEFHTYVQPQEHPVLSEFCTELTGITQV